jgi:hypothetical protein
MQQRMMRIIYSRSVRVACPFQMQAVAFGTRNAAVI